MTRKDELKKKTKKVEKTEKKLKRILAYSLKNNHCETALEAIAADAELKYQWNQNYVDEELENAVEELKEKLSLPKYECKEASENTILFYDGFGEDTRGLMLIYVQNLLAIGYHVVYVTVESAAGNQPGLDKISRGQNFVTQYIPYDKKYENTIRYIIDVFMRYKPLKAFLYTLPYDVAGIVVFNQFRGIVQRFQINLTDHAFWLGVNTFDYCIEFRDYGANISIQYRGIDETKIMMLPYYPYVDYDVPFEGFPFEADGHKIVFSGGGLYKTIDKQNTFYRVVEKMLEHDLSVIFLYAGQGDDTELKKLVEKYPDRVYHIQERKDLFQIMKRIYFYFNTYPLAGGLMTQYAVLAGKIPVTLIRKHDNSIDGVLLNQDRIKVQFDSPEKCLEEIYRLLDDKDYLLNRELMLKNCVLREYEFRENLKGIVDENVSKMNYSERMIQIDQFRQGYRESFDEKMIYKLITRDERGKVTTFFNEFWIKKKVCTLVKLINKLNKRN